MSTRYRQVQSPSKYMSLRMLYAIRDNNYCGVFSGKGSLDYAAEEVDSLIWNKEARKTELETERLMKERG